MSTTVLLEILLGVLLTISAIVTVAVLWPGRPRPPSTLEPPPPCRPPLTDTRPRSAAGRRRRHRDGAHLHRPGDHGGDGSRRSPVATPGGRELY
ncbi:hypothetical protein [Streptosporangium subroseum]|uniref:hypothetical protein n=1 Tax=Streptosporangium subroseum TaxID=106412 RepID=UPI0030853137|nr:hypothetical protein OHB15_28820 [Streptosporangium subroseum]